MTRPCAALTAMGFFLMAGGLAQAAEDPCAALDRAFPQPGRTGLAGENAFRPLPLLAPMRAVPRASGTLSLAMAMDHVSQLPAGKPGFVYVGNYPVTNIPAFRIVRGSATSFNVVRPEDGRSLGMTDACIASPSWGFGGTQWALVQGDTLDVLLRSNLDYSGPTAVPEPTNGAVPCQATNLHTHGLLVSPYHPARPGIGPYGDYVLDVTVPRGNPDWGADSDSCGTVLGVAETHHHGVTALPLHYVTTIPGTPGVSSLASGEHPSGLFWYHPHPHGFSKIQVHGGTTGAITIGAITDYACPDGDGTPGACTLSNANVRVMALKDTEIQSYGAGGLWASVLNTESGFCSNSGGTRHGECQANEKGLPGKWVFTINGVQYPTIRPGAGKTEIWRLINASNGLSYVLSLDGAGPGAASLPFQVLANDGVSVRQDSTKPVIRTRILMMPSSRVEIAIPAPPGGGAFVLHNQAVATGAKGSGDVWPDVDLARVVWEKTGALAPAQLAPPMRVAGPQTPLPAAVSGMDQSRVPARCRFHDGDTRVIYFVHRFNTVPDVGIKEIFGLIAGIRHPDGGMDFFNADQPDATLHDVAKVWKAGIAGVDTNFPGFMHNPWGTICTVKGTVEPWELQNWTGEDHNFHIHQAKFTINPAGTFQYPQPEANTHPDLALGDSMVRGFADPQGPPAYHDNAPVPRGQSFCDIDRHAPGCTRKTPDDNLQCSGEPGAARCANPGKTSLILDFSRAEQVGTYVYHCHILEHEDGGMMAQITVLCPPGDTACAAQQAAHAPICRPVTP